MPIDFKSPDSLKTSILDNIDEASIGERDLPVVEQAIADPSVSIQSVNESDLKDGDKAMVALTMLIGGNIDRRDLAHTAANLHDFVSQVVDAAGSDYRALLRADDQGTDPFTRRTPNQITGVGTDQFQLSQDGRAQVTIRRTGGRVDTSSFDDWSPEALQQTIDLIDTVANPGADALTRRFKRKVDDASGGILSDVKDAMTQVREAKLAKIRQGAEVLNSPPSLESARARKVPKASIDAVGAALDGALENPAASEALPSYAQHLHEQVREDIAVLTEAESQALDEALGKLPDDVPLTPLVTNSAGVEGRALRLLFAFRSLENALEDSSVSDMLHNCGSAREALVQLIDSGWLENYSQPLLDAFHAPDPQNLEVGQPLPVNIGRIDSVRPYAPNDQEARSAYGLTNGRYTLFVRVDGVTSQLHGEAIDFDDLSMEALQALTHALFAASADSATPALAMFRKSAERTHPDGVAMATLLEKASTALTNKTRAQVDRTTRGAEALASLSSIQELSTDEAEA